MKAISVLFLFILLYLNATYINSQELPLPPWEVYLENGISDDVNVVMYPISTIISGDNQCSFEALYKSPGAVYYLNGVRIENNLKATIYTIHGNENAGYNFDDGEATSLPIGLMGRGIIKIVFSQGTTDPITDSLIIHQDGGQTYDMFVKWVSNLHDYGWPENIPGLDSK